MKERVGGRVLERGFVEDGEGGGESHQESTRLNCFFGIVGSLDISGCAVVIALTSRLISLAGVKWSCLRMNKPAFPPVPIMHLMTLARGPKLNASLN